MNMIRLRVLCFNIKTVTLLHLLPVFLLNTSYSYAQNATSSALLEEIVVTATKKKNVESIHDVPIAISAFNSEQLDALKIRDVVGLNYVTPNTSIEEVGTIKGIANFAIRGLGINSSIPSIEPTVGVFVDGLYYGINSGVVFDTFDLESVEILRGPQGVLFGRNVTGGALVINTNDPDFKPSSTFKVAAESGLRGTGANYYIQGSTTGTLIKDTLAGKLAVYYNDDKGWFENTLEDGSQTDFGASDSLIIRPSLTWQPNDATSLTAKYEYGDFSGDGPAAQSHTNSDGVDGLVNNFSRNSFDFSVDEESFSESEWQNLSLETNIDVAFGNGRITNILGYREIENKALSDIDATFLNLFNAEIKVEQEQISNELRYNGQFGNWNITTGLFYFEQDIAYSETRFILQGILPDALSISPGGGVLDQSTIGLFTHAEYQVNERLKLSAGLRYSDEEKEVQIASIIPLTQPNIDCRVINNDCIFDFSESTNPGETTFKTDNISHQLGAQYIINNNSNVYINWGRSFRAGGFNLRNTSTNRDDLASFDDEKVDSFEIGWKYKATNGSTLNITAFLTDIEDLQREVNTSDISSGITQVVRNTANAEIIGLELDGKLPVTENLILTASLGYLDGEYKDVFFDLNGDTVINQDDLDLDIPRLIDLSYNLGVIYQRQLGDLGNASLQLNYGHKSGSAFTDDNRGLIKSTNRLDANITLARDNGLSLSLYGKNLTNEVIFTGEVALQSLIGPQPLGGTFAPLTKGRVIGIEAQYDF